MTNFKITKAKKLPRGYKVARNYKKRVKESTTEYFPLTKTPVGYRFFVPERDARSLRGSLHMNRGNRKGLQFVSETVKSGRSYGTYVYRVK